MIADLALQHVIRRGGPQWGPLSQNSPLREKRHIIRVQELVLGLEGGEKELAEEEGRSRGKANYYD